MDQFRDYRFYKEDMIHPTEQAVKYITTMFMNNTFKDSEPYLQSIKNLNNSINHKSLHEGSEENIQFLNNTLERISQIEHTYPHLSLEKEFNLIRTKIDHFKKS